MEQRDGETCYVLVETLDFLLFKRNRSVAASVRLIMRDHQTFIVFFSFSFSSLFAKSISNLCLLKCMQHREREIFFHLKRQLTPKSKNTYYFCTCKAVYVSRLFWFELASFGGKDFSLFSDIIELNCTQFRVLKVPTNKCIKLNNNVSFQKLWPCIFPSEQWYCWHHMPSASSSIILEKKQIAVQLISRKLTAKTI